MNKYLIKNIDVGTAELTFSATEVYNMTPEEF